MFGVSWGEVAVATGLGLFLIGRRDLPKAAHVVGTQVGRVVGFLQGARARADRLTQNDELRQLQAELRQGLRELDAVQSELTVSMSMSRSLQQQPHQPQQQQQKQHRPLLPPVSSRQTPKITPTTSATAAIQGGDVPIEAFTTTAATTTTTTTATIATGTSSPSLAPTPMQSTTAYSMQSNDDNYSSLLLSSTHHQSLAAVAEQEWKNRGMEFVSRAEQQGFHSADQQQQPKTGSALLASMIQDSLIYDQYDRVVREQEQALQNKLAQKMHEKQQDMDNRKKKK